MPSTLEQAAEIGRAQATMHVALKDFPLERAEYRNHSYWRSVAREIKPTLSPADSVVLNSLLGLYDALTAMYPDRPRGFIHSDLFRDNTLFEGNELKGILDFYELNKDELLFAKTPMAANKRKVEIYLTSESCLNLSLPSR